MGVIGAGSEAANVIGQRPTDDESLARWDVVWKRRHVRIQLRYGVPREHS